MTEHAPIIAFILARCVDDEVTARRTAIRRVIETTLAYESKIDGEWGCCHNAIDIGAGRCDEIDPGKLPALRALAEIWADHADYRAKWAYEGDWVHVP